MCSSLQITYSVPFSVTAELTAGTGGGQGLSCCYISPSTCVDFVGPYFGGLLYLFAGLATGVLNLAIVVPQVYTLLMLKS